MMWNDPIVAEVHAIRARLSDEHGGDLHRIAEHFRAAQQRYTARLVSFPPRRPAGWKPPAAAPAEAQT